MGPFRSCVERSIEASMHSSSSSRAPATRIAASSTTRERRGHEHLAANGPPGTSFAGGASVADSTISNSAPAASANAAVPERTGEPTPPADARSQFAPMPVRDLNDRLVGELIDAVKAILRKETSDRLRD